MKSKKKTVNLILYISIATASVIFAFFFSFGARNFFRCRSFIIEYASSFGLGESEVAAVIKAESNFNPNAKSTAGAIGLMQIMPDTADYVSKLTGEKNYDLFDAETNIRFGCFYLSYLKRKFSSEETAYAAYNAGEGKVKEWLLDERYSADGVTLSFIPYPETANYVKKVIYYKKAFSIFFKKPDEREKHVVFAPVFLFETDFIWSFLQNSTNFIIF